MNEGYEWGIWNEYMEWGYEWVYGMKDHFPIKYIEWLYNRICYEYIYAMNRIWYENVMNISMLWIEYIEWL